MEQYHVKKINSPIDWTVEVPGSKSITNRALLLAALSDGTVQIEGVLFSEDSRCFLQSLASLGFEVLTEEEKKRVTVKGCGGRIPQKEAEIYVGSAGTAARFLTAMLGMSDGSYTIQASEQMKKRPMLPLFQLLEKELGAHIVYLEKEEHLPIQIFGCCRPERDLEEDKTCPQDGTRHTVELDISKSTQFLSALLLVSPMVKQGMKIHITSQKKDGSYIRITRKMMEEFGVKAEFDGEDYIVPPNVSYHMDTYAVEPDMSAACYFYAAAAVTGGTALVKNIHYDNTQGDLKFLEVLKQMGCIAEDTPQGIRVTGPKAGRLKGLTVDMNDFSDQALTLSAIAPFADGPVKITNIAHIRRQESDRLSVIAAELTKLGIRCEEEPDCVTIFPGSPKSGAVDTYEDHRVAMAFSLIGLRTEGITINDPGCCAKTFEDYFTLLTQLTAKEDQNV